MTLIQQQDKHWTILEILQWTKAYLHENGIQTPRLTSEILLAHTLKQDRMYLYVHYDQTLKEDERMRFKALVRQRIQRVPTEYLSGEKEFWSLPFSVTPAVLIPRPETEHLVEAALEAAQASTELKILDLGTGSGIIAVTLKHEVPQAHVYAGDISEQALEVARQNAARLLPEGSDITFAQGDLFTPWRGMRFDMIVSNPPYICESDYLALAPEVREHEPRQALYAGQDGLDVYRRLIAEAPEYLAPGGSVFVEIGYDEKEAVVALFQQAGFEVRKVIRDYAGHDRVIVASI